MPQQKRIQSMDLSTKVNNRDAILFQNNMIHIHFLIQLANNNNNNNIHIHTILSTLDLLASNFVNSFDTTVFKENWISCRTKQCQKM